MRVKVGQAAKRKIRKISKRHANIGDLLNSFVNKYEVNPKDASLRLHKLKNMSGLWSVSLGYDLRLIFRYDNGGIVITDIGSHDEVY